MFAKITVLIMEAVKQQIRDFNAKHFPIILKRILFFGGLSKSPHVQKSLRRYFLDDEIMGYPVDVVLPLRTSRNEVVVARGAVMMSLRSKFIIKRFRRRNFGVGQDVPPHWVPRRIRGNAKALIDIEDQEPRLPNRAIWLFRNGEEFDDRPIRFHRGWRCLPPKGILPFREYLISSPRELEE
ncbi:MAG: hypothetical protein LQ339_002466 [Xanthoria mediterranea]|nr:MAG: hypothetical protein LQ339_002466 [Xanthoria mediterranea]